MLILSRRADQKIVFPNLGISLHVLKVRGQLVKLGVEAPAEIKIMRSEAIVEDESFAPLAESLPAAAAVESTGGGPAEHALRNRLNALQLKLQVLQRQVDRGRENASADEFDHLVEDMAAIDTALSPAKACIGPPQAQRTARLLIVDDADNERGLLAYLLSSQGFDVSVARDGVEALEQLQAGLRPDLILLDMNMPISGGEETLNRIRSTPQFADLPVFAVTGMRRPSETQAGTGRGWDGWFVKPININSLIDSMQQRLADFSAHSA